MVKFFGDVVNIVSRGVFERYAEETWLHLS